MKKTPTLRSCSRILRISWRWASAPGLSPVAPAPSERSSRCHWRRCLRTFTSDIGFLAAVVIAFVVGVWAAHRTGRDLGVSDHGAIVWDEVVAFLLVLYFIGAGPVREAFAFLLFRFFDIVKPPPARMIDREWHHGFGVMADDIVAAFYALLVLALWQRLFP